MKSKYITHTFFEGKHYLHSALSGALCGFDNESYKKVTQIIDADNRTLDPELYDDLVKSEFIVESNNAELEFIKQRRRTILNDNIGSTLFISIAPTLDCNFRCNYCYQTFEETIERDKTYMTRETQDSIINFAKNNKDKFDKVSLSWYGGEPLLSIGVIKYISNSLRDEFGDGFFGGGIVTNGSLLTPEVVETLFSCRIKGAQVTIDGNRETHNKSRPFSNGAGSYDLIMNNIQKAVEKGFSIHVRVNYNIDSHKVFYDVLNDLKEKGLDKNNVSVSIALIRENSCERVNCSECSTEDNNETEIQSKQIIEFYKACLDYGFLSSIKAPKPFAGYCMFIQNNDFNITPSGLVAPCLEDIGDPSIKTSVGNINTDLENILELRKVFSAKYSELVDIPPSCTDCHVLPLCLCECPKDRIGHSSFKKASRCVYYKYNLHELTKILVRKHK